jgi:hypothetical protein
LRLDGSTLDPSARIEALVRFCAEHGAIEADVRAFVERVGERAGRSGAAAARQAAAGRRARLEVGWRPEPEQPFPTSQKKE